MVIEIPEIVIVSGGFDPMHKGHVRLMQRACSYGALYVLLNSDEWLVKKKGKAFMKFDDRMEILAAMRWVCTVKEVDDSDGSVCKGLEEIRKDNPDVSITFANGGDRLADNIPEVETCKKNNIKMVFNVGGNKIESSSELIKRIGGTYFNRKLKSGELKLPPEGHAPPSTGTPVE